MLLNLMKIKKALEVILYNMKYRLLLKLNNDMYENFGVFGDYQIAKIMVKFISQIKNVKEDNFYIEVID